MASILLASVGLVSCDDILNVKSDRLTFEQDYQMGSLNDTIYGMVGIYSQLQKLADTYVLLGELRGDLLDVTENSSQDLRDISNFEISKTNSYVNIKDFYAVINNCNYLIHTIDTSVVLRGEKVMYRYYAAAKGVRAWTYMQIALNFGTAKYYDKPIITLADAEKEYPEYTMEQLAPLLINDLLPWRDTEPPTFMASASAFSIRFLLGDLYLWTNQYEKAATEYYNLMYEERILINKGYQSVRALSNNVISNTFTEYWRYSYMFGGAELITAIICPSTYGQRFELDSLNFRYELTPSAVAVNNWDSQVYFNTELNTAPGDLRKHFSVINKNTILTSTPNLLEVTTNPKDTRVQNIVYKYLWNSPAENVQTIVIYRASLLYLRYAEAVNRLGKPNLAFAVIKNGLRSTTLSSPAIFPTHERTVETFTNFSDFRFDNNVGIRTRGLGPNLEKDTLYRIPEQPLLSDSILYVEDLIQQELALEMAFEGNRYHDLMRLALRRNDPAYLARKVAAKHGTNAGAIESKLMNQANWYVKK